MKDRMLNCPNCGAPITGPTCEYCGTMFFDFANMEVGKPGYLRLKINNRIVTMKARPVIATIPCQDDVCLYADNAVFKTVRPRTHVIRLDLHLIPDDDGILYTERRETNGHERDGGGAYP